MSQHIANAPSGQFQGTSGLYVSLPGQQTTIFCTMNWCKRSMVSHRHSCALKNFSTSFTYCSIFCHGPPFIIAVYQAVFLKPICRRGCYGLFEKKPLLTWRHDFDLRGLFVVALRQFRFESSSRIGLGLVCFLFESLLVQSFCCTLVLIIDFDGKKKISPPQLFLFLCWTV